MKYRCFLFLLAINMIVGTLRAQVMSGASQTVATDVPHTTIPYLIEDKGTKLPDITWGLDQAWIWDWNMRRGLNFAGQEMIEIVRLSFQPSHSVEGGSLSEEQIAALDERIRIAKFARFAKINLNSDPQDGKVVANWYRSGSSTTLGKRWAQLIGLTKQYVESKGLKVVSISPFNEPDYTAWNQGTKATFKAICKAIREDSQFNGVILCGGNVLNPDFALEWYNYSKEYLDEGNTHQLAGSFDSFANFYTQVKADGKVGVGDELHNTMECMVASEYGMTKGIWWGTCDHTRSQFMKASRGTRLGYAENRSRWVAASVYRFPDSYKEGCSIQGFVGTSERQAAQTTFRFAALDHDVFYNGYGPTREYIICTPGHANTGGYDTEGTYCRNAEALVNIQGGDDVMPQLPTKTSKYRIVNAFSGKSLAPESNSATSGKIMHQVASIRNNKSQQWLITPDAYDIGGDFTYFTLANFMDQTLYPDVLNNSFDEGASIILFKGGLGDNEKWFFEYAGNGNFYIRNKHSGLYLQVLPGSEKEMNTVRAVNQGSFTGELIQQWKLINIDAADITYKTAAPSAPTALTAKAQLASVRLDWTAPKGNDIKEYIVLRSVDQEKWTTIHNNVVGKAYIDNTVEAGHTYYYKVRTVNQSLNRSVDSEIVSASVASEPGCVMHMAGDSLLDATLNGNHAAIHGDYSLADGKIGKAIDMQPSGQNFLQLPATIANTPELTFSAWIYYRGGNAWQRIFDFGVDTEHYVFLTPNNSYTGKMRLGIKNGGAEETLDANVPATGAWTHVAVTFSAGKVVLYVNGAAVATSTSMKTRPADFRPIFNYIGRSQFSDPYFNGLIDDVRIFNYALTSEEVASIASLTDGITTIASGQSAMDNGSGAWYDISGRQVVNGKLPNRPIKRGIYIINGKKVIVK